MPTVAKHQFFSAELARLGKDPTLYQGRNLSMMDALEEFCICRQQIRKWISGFNLSHFYDYENDTIWFDALELAYLSNYCREI